MNGRSVGPPNPAGDQSALSLLVNAADSRDNPGARRDASGGLSGAAGGSLADTLRLRGFAGAGEPSFEEQLMLQQQAQSLLGAGGGGSSMLLSQLRDQQGLLSQLGGSLGGAGGANQQNQQLAALLGLGGGPAAAANPGNDVRSALAAQLRQSQQQQQQQQQQQHQLSHADILALSRSGALSSGGIAGLMSRMGGAGGGMSGFGGSGLASELENLQRLEELERRQRLMSSAMAGGGSSLAAQQAAAQASANAAAAAGQNAMDTSGGMHGSVLRDDRMTAAHLSRAPPPAQEMASGTPKAKPPTPIEQVPPISQVACKPVPVPNESNKEELEKTPGSVIVPCRARGMPMDHNFKVRTTIPCFFLCFFTMTRA